MMRKKLIRVFLVAAALTLLSWGFEAIRWNRWEHYDQTSPDGRYTIRVYGDIFHFSMTMGGGADRAAKVELVENETGKVLGSGRVPALRMVRDTLWCEDEALVTVGDEGVQFRLPSHVSMPSAGVRRRIDPLSVIAGIVPAE